MYGLLKARFVVDNPHAIFNRVSKESQPHQTKHPRLHDGLLTTIAQGMLVNLHAPKCRFLALEHEITTFQQNGKGAENLPSLPPS
jgi:hypothetical protein